MVILAPVHSLVAVTKSNASGVSNVISSELVRAGDNALCVSAYKHTLLAFVFFIILVAGLALAWYYFLGQRKDAAEPRTDGDRIAVLDTAKFFLMIFVVLIHASIYNWPFAWTFISFCNPAVIKCYAFLSGLSAQKPPSQQKFKNLLIRLVLPTILFSFLLQPFLQYLINWKTPRNLTELGMMWRKNFFHGGAWTNWYLFGLLWWHVVSYFLQSLKPVWRLSAAVAFAAIGGGGGDDESLFSFTMAISSLPIFVVGQLFPLDEVLAAVSYGSRSVCLGGMCMIILGLLQMLPFGMSFMEDIPKYSWGPAQPEVWWKSQSDPCTVSGLWFMWVRGALFRNGLELVKSLLFVFCLCPRSQNLFSHLGQYSLYPMLLHMPIVDLELKIFRDSGSASWSMTYPRQSSFLIVLCWIAQLAFCGVLTAILSSKPVRNVFGIFIEPTWAAKLLDQDQESAAGRPSGKADGKGKP